MLKNHINLGEEQNNRFEYRILETVQTEAWGRKRVNEINSHSNQENHQAIHFRCHCSLGRK